METYILDGENYYYNNGRWLASNYMSAPMAQVSRLNKLRLEKESAEKKASAIGEKIKKNIKTKDESVQNATSIAGTDVSTARERSNPHLSTPNASDSVNNRFLMRLQKTILKNFGKKTFIGDIQINQEEFSLLVEYLKNRYKQMKVYGNRFVEDPVLCVALVQIGIRYYDGRFWPHVKKLLNDASFGPNQQSWFGVSYVDTLRKNEKLRTSFSDRVDAILMHAFVTDKYASRFFDYLYAFYSIDLDRDISRLDRDTMRSLVEIIKRNDNTGRTYYLVEHTAEAVRQNERGAKTRIRYYLKLIDKAFWGDPLPESSRNRLVQRFLEWKDSSEFIQERARYSTGGKGGRKSFSSPYLRYNGRVFSIIIPEQMLEFREFFDVRWVVESTHHSETIRINPYSAQGVTGYKTEQEMIPIEADSIFDLFVISLMDGDNRLKSFRIPKDIIRFFDNEGYLIRNDALPQGMVHAFTENGRKPMSEAVIESAIECGLTRTSFELEEGDIIRVPDGKPITVGGTLKEGVLPRGRIVGVIAEKNEEEITVYKSIPKVLVKMLPQRATGTAISINKKIIRFDTGEKKGIAEFDLLDRSGEKGYLVDLNYFGCKKDGVYSIVIDVPNDRTIRQWKFALINQLEYEFEDAPYIFKSRGTLRLPLDSKLKATGTSREEIQEYKRINFDIEAGASRLYLDYLGLKVGFDVPTFSYKFYDEAWMTEPHVDIWHEDFEPRLSISYGSDRLRFYLDDIGEDDIEEVRAETFTKTKKKGVFECDLNRFKSWFGRESMIRTIYLDLPGIPEQIPFVRVVTKSYLVSGMLRADYKKKLLIGEFDIIGYADYCVDIIRDGQTIVEKAEIKDKRLKIKSDLKTGIYTIIVYESYADESGFGEDIRYEIGRFNTELLNPEDLSGMSVQVSRIHLEGDDAGYLPLQYCYQVVDLQTSEEFGYDGKMIVSDKHGVKATFPVRVEFFDPDKLQHSYITFIEDDETCEFLYDEYRKSIVKQEYKAISKSEAYRRYKISLFPEDYVFDVMFIEKPKNAGIEVSDESYNNLKDQKSLLKRLMTESIFEK